MPKFCLVLALLAAVACGPKSLPEGEVYRSLDDQTVIRVQSSTELDYQRDPSEMAVVAQYTIEDGSRLRMVIDVLGTPRASFFEITDEGLSSEEIVLYSAPTIEEARRLAKEAELAAKATGLAALKDQYASLFAKRQEISEVESQGDQSSALGNLRSEEKLTIESLIAGLDGFLNSDSKLLKADENLDAMELEAEQMKVSVLSLAALRDAQALVDQFGDYSLALSGLNSSLELDPENANLRAMVARLEIEQYMTGERFAAVSKGMTQSEVRAILGTVHSDNVREHPSHGLVMWFYRRADGGAASVSFLEKSGESKVWELNFNAVKAR